MTSRWHLDAKAALSAPDTDTKLKGRRFRNESKSRRAVERRVSASDRPRPGQTRKEVKGTPTLT